MAISPAFRQFVADHPELEDLYYYTDEGGPSVLLPSAIRTMAVNGQFDRLFGGSTPRKFDATGQVFPGFEMSPPELT